MWITCQWLDLLQLTTRRSAATEAHLLGVCRLLVVFTEGDDLCPFKDREILPEACEIGVQGDSFAASTLRVRPRTETKFEQ